MNLGKTSSTSSMSSWSIILIAIYFLITFFTQSSWKDRDIIVYDSINYYSYLPAAFIYNDLHFNFADSINQESDKWIVYYFVNEEGKRCQKMTAGKAVMDIPMFLLAHTWATIDPTNKANGYDVIYHFFIGLSGIMYSLLALIFMRKILKLHVNDTITAFTLVFIACGTNLFFYSTYETGMAHPVGLFLVSSFIWHTILFVDKNRYKSLIIAFLSLGLATLVRPTNVIFGLFFIGYFWESNSGLKTLFQDIHKNYKKYIIAIIAFLLPLFFQMGLWKYMSGHWIQYSYQEEGFFFSQPKIFKGIFSARNGIVLYSPILLFSFVGMFFKLNKKYRLTLILTISVFFYVIYSWWCWWYGGSFGSRAAIESYSILAIFLATFLSFTTRKLKKKTVIFILILPLSLAIYFTGNFSQKARVLKIHYDSMTYKSYFDILLRSKSDNNYLDHIETPDYSNASDYGKEYINFKKLTQVNNTSNNIILPTDNYNIGDTIFIKCHIWDGDKFVGKRDYISLVLSSSDGNSNSNFTELKLKPKNISSRWNDFIVPFIFPPQFVGKKLAMKYKYLGDFRCYYKDPEIVSP